MQGKAREMVDGILQALHEVEGVQATLVVNGAGQLLAHRAHALYDRGLLQAVSRTIVDAIDSLQLVHDDWEMLTASFADGKLLVRNLNAGRDRSGVAVALAVVADARINASFAGVAMRVAGQRLKSGVPAPPKE
jgi:predicted regulator of Ras-like GTPase activity (Roadblock/LC7/MglB family)